jgi:phthalate 4,5-dioxygenase
MGVLSPRWEEHLGTTDRAIIEFRKLLLGLTRDLLEGKEPDAAHNADAYRVRSAAFTIGKDIPWEEGSLEHVKARV